MTNKTEGLRIALISAFPPARQSLNEYGLNLALGFARRDDVAEVIVIADRCDDDIAELDLGPKIRVRRTWDFNSPMAALQITRALRKERADAALFNIQTASFGNWEVPAALGLFAPALARLTGTRSGVLAHNLIGGIDLDNTQLKGQRIRQAITRLGGAVVNRALMSADYLAVTLESYREMVARDYPKANVALIPHGTFDTVDRPVRPSAERPMRIVTMGKFGTYKRLETLVAAFEILSQDPRFANLELVIGGTDHPGTPGYMASVAEKTKGNGRIRFAGYLAEEDIPAFFGDARVSAFDYESTTGSSGVLHQTASYGAVPVFPRIGDFIDVCRDEGLSGLNYAPGDAAGMAQAMADILSDPAMADTLAESNRAASMGMPFDDVIARHMTLLTNQGDRESTLPANESAACPT